MLHVIRPAAASPLLESRQSGLGDIVKRQRQFQQRLLMSCAALAATLLVAAQAADRNRRAAQQAGESSGAQTTQETATASAAPDIEANAPRVRLTTSEGVFVIALYPQRAPLSTANFLRYVDEGFYANTLFHRVIGNFVVQGGGFSAADESAKPTHEFVANESGSGLRNVRGTVGAARSENPHSASSEFYINIADNPDLDPLPTRWGYAVFGRVVEGMDVVDRMGTVATGSVGPFKKDSPLKPIVIQKAERLPPAK